RLSKPHRQAADEVAQRTAVARQRRNRDPLLGSVMARAGGPELDRGYARGHERRHVGCAVAPDAQRLALDRAGNGIAERADVRIGSGDGDRWMDEGPSHLDPRDLTN